MMYVSIMYVCVFCCVLLCFVVVVVVCGCECGCGWVCCVCVFVCVFMQTAMGAKNEPLVLAFCALRCGPCAVLSPQLDLVSIMERGRLRVLKMDTEESLGVCICIHACVCACVRVWFYAQLNAVIC